MNVWFGFLWPCFKSFLWTKEAISNSISTNSSLDSTSLLSSTNYSLVPTLGLSFYPVCSSSINLLSIQYTQLCLQQYVCATASSLTTPRIPSHNVSFTLTMEINFLLFSWSLPLGTSALSFATKYPFTGSNGVPVKQI